MSAAAASSAAVPAVAPAVVGALHPNVVPVSSLLGVWVGVGRGVYPTIGPFAYEEQLEFRAAPGKPFVAYTQRTWKADSARTKPMHEENGFLRFVGPADARKVEAIISQCTGVQEVLSGQWKSNSDAAATPAAAAAAAATPAPAPASSFTIELRTAPSALTRTPSALHPFVTAVVRRYTIDTAANSLRVQVDMATENTPDIQNHLTATLAKQADK